MAVGTTAATLRRAATTLSTDGHELFGGIKKRSLSGARASALAHIVDLIEFLPLFGSICLIRGTLL
jgi:hypothetical protein